MPNLEHDPEPMDRIFVVECVRGSHRLSVAAVDRPGHPRHGHVYAGEGHWVPAGDYAARFFGDRT